MRRSEVVPSEDELKREEDGMRDGLPLQQAIDVEAWVERTQQERAKHRADRQALYDRTQR